MSVIENYLYRRRKKKLEKVNEALEKLKREHPFDPSSFKPKTQASSPGETQTTSLKPWIVGTLILLALAAVVMTSMFFLYKGKYSALQETYAEQESALALLQADLKEKEEALEEMDDTLQTQAEKELNLSDQSSQLLAEKKILEQQVKDLQDKIVVKQAELLSLNLTIGVLNKEILEWQDCIEDEFGGNTTSCNI